MTFPIVRLSEKVFRKEIFMTYYNCSFDENGILTGITEPGDEFSTCFLLSFGDFSCDRSPEIIRKWEETGRDLIFSLTVANNTDAPMNITDPRFLVRPNAEAIRSDFTEKLSKQDLYSKQVIQHACICGHGSYIYWIRPSGEGNILAAACLADTSLVKEYDTDIWSVAVPEFCLEPGESKDFGFAFRWIPNQESIQDFLYDVGAVSLKIFPGLTVPADMTLKLKADCKTGIKGISCDDSSAGISQSDDIYSLNFSSPGEKKIRFEYGDGYRTEIVCYSTYSMKELVDLRAKHIVEKQQYRGDKWYDGMFSQWNMDLKRMTTYEDRMELMDYMISSDDPGLCKAPFIAEKNIFRPVREEIEAVEYYIEHFLWGKLQRDDTEAPYEYAIIGADNWKQNRESGSGFHNGGHGEERMWRTFDYTHIIQLYYNMYRIATLYPDTVKYLDADGYLERARRTALAYFEIPYNIFMRDGWSFRGYTDWAFKLGNFHEKYIIDVMDATGDEKLREYWENKVKYMIYDDPIPYGSEMNFDTTAFESTEAVAHYALTRDVRHGVNDFLDKNMYSPGEVGYRSHPELSREKTVSFLERQMHANLAARGCQMRQYDLYGSDFRAGKYQNYRLSYMSQMGGWAVLDYALYFAEDPYSLLRTAYASLLSSWCLVNTGTNDFFFPAAENPGACGWSFQPKEENGSLWGVFRCRRGPVQYDGEIDNGLSGYLRGTCSVLADDPDFGLTAYGGKLENTDSCITVFPADGVRQRFHCLCSGDRIHVSLDRDAIRRIRISADYRTFVFDIENVTEDEHSSAVSVNGTEYGYTFGKGCCCTEIRVEV